MSKLIMLKGLPGSGKSTWAQQQVMDNRLKSPQWVRVNKDDIRAAIGKPWSQELEKEVLRKRDFEIAKGLSAGKTVISDDTNFAPKHEARLKEIAKKYKADFELDLRFLEIPIETCIARDLIRDEKVGEKVIREMAEKYLKLDLIRTMVSYVPIVGAPKAVLCDLDGTLAIHNGRTPFDYDKCDTDLINHAVDAVLVAMGAQGYDVVFVSGREGVARAKTQAWLEAHGWGKAPLFMRGIGDYRKDNVVKYEIFDDHIRNVWDVEFVLDDRDQVVKMWREIGLTCFQVNYGNF